MKKILAILTNMIVLGTFFVPVMPVAQAAPIRPEGYVEQVLSGGSVKGWFWDNDQPVDLFVTYQNLDNGESRYYVINPQQASNKISYFSQRDDVKSYIRNKYPSATFHYPQGFLLTGNYLPNGRWKLVSVTEASIFASSLPITAGNTTFTVTSSQPYIEGYVDSTSGGAIKGWAYDSSLNPQLNIGPEIYLRVKNVQTAEVRDFTFATNDGSSLIYRTARQDVSNFLSNYRGQSPSYFDHPTNAMSGFTINLSASSHPIPSGTWHIEQLTMDGVTIPYGNTNPADTFVIY
jgi:hypothetical protein